MKAHKEENVLTRVALLEQAYSNNTEILQEIKTKIEFTTKEIKDDLKEIKQDIKYLCEEVKTEAKSLRDHVDIRLDRLNSRLWTLFFWMVGGGGSILYVIAKSSHWLN